MPRALTGLLRTYLHELGYQPPERIPLRLVRQGGPGDFSSAVAHAVAGAAPGGAERLADALADRLRGEDHLAQVWAADGYLTLTLTSAALAEGVRRLLRATTPGQGGTTEWPAELLPVAFAYARCRNVARAARAHGVRPVQGEELDSAVSAVVDHEPARALLVCLAADHPGGPGAGLALRDLAAAYQSFFTHTRTSPRGGEPVTSRYRTHLAVTEASAVALATGLASLGLHAPEHL